MGRIDFVIQCECGSYLKINKQILKDSSSDVVLIVEKCRSCCDEAKEEGRAEQPPEKE